MHETVLQIAHSLKRIGDGIFQHVHRHSTLFLVVLSLIVVTLFYFQIRTATPPEQIVLLTGPAGGGGEKLGKMLSEKLRPPGFWSLNQRNVQLVTQATDGYEDNRQRIQEDTTGRQIAFAQDGFNPHRNVQILLPLEQSYTHIIVNREFLDAARKLLENQHRDRADAENSEPAGAASRMLWFEDLKPVLTANGGAESKANAADTLFQKWAKNKVFLGPELSGTRQVARLILDHHGVPVNRLDCEADYDWNEMVTALIRNEINLAFITTEPGNRAVRRLAGRGGFVLLGLKDTEGLCQSNPHVLVRDFKKHVYGASQNAADFCPTTTATIATRRVLICSSHMENASAYWLAQRLTEAIRSEVPEIHWETEAKPTPEPRALTYHIHPGVQSFKEEVPWYSVMHAYIPSMFWPLILSTILASVLFVLKWINDLLSLENGAMQTGKTLQTSEGPSDSGGGPHGPGTNGQGGPEGPDHSGSPPPVADRTEFRRQPSLPAEELVVTTNGQPAMATNGQPAPQRAASALETQTAGFGSGGNGDSAAYCELVARLNAALHEIQREESEGDRLPSHGYRRWQGRIREIKRTMAEAFRKGHVDDAQRQILTQAIGELEWELELLRPERVSRRRP